MKAGDRVRILALVPGATHGTIEATFAGYLRVKFDDGITGRFSYAAAADQLEIVTGDDALPRHVWKDRGGELWTCDTCGVEQTEANEREACTPAAAAAGAIA
jgi:hypothetical protein